MRGAPFTVIGTLVVDGAGEGVGVDGAGVLLGLLLLLVTTAAAAPAAAAPAAVTRPVVAPAAPALAPAAPALALIPSEPALAGAGNSLNGE